MGAVPVADVGTADVLRALEPIWRTKTTTASAVRARIEAVLSYATVQGWRQGPNPAIWRGNLALLLPAPRKLRNVEHHAALRWQDIPAFMRELRARDTISARCLEFTILTAVRSGEARGARWEEIDLDAAVWSIPAERMKARGELRVPLTAPAIELLRCIEPLAVDGFIFPGRPHKPGRRLAAQPMNDATLRKLLGKMGRGDLTVHGFRSTFKDWATESTTHRDDVSEAALAHVVGSATRRAYQRGDLFDKRRAIMADWADYLSRPPAEVITLRRA